MVCLVCLFVKQIEPLSSGGFSWASQEGREEGNLLPSSPSELGFILDPQAGLIGPSPELPELFVHFSITAPSQQIGTENPGCAGHLEIEHEVTTSVSVLRELRSVLRELSPRMTAPHTHVNVCCTRSPNLTTPGFQTL